MLSVITKGLEAAQKTIERENKQARYAAAVALTRTAICAREDIQKEAKNDLDRPTPFTLRGFRYERANKRTLQSRVYIAPIQAEYLYYSIEGGIRRKRARRGEAVPIEGNLRLNKYGNIPARAKGKIKQLMAQPDTFVGSVRGIYGVWQRGHRSKTGRFSLSSGGLEVAKGRKPGHKRGLYRQKRASTVRLLLRLEPFVRYKPRFDFHEAGERCFDTHFSKEFEKAYKLAMATAR